VSLSARYGATLAARPLAIVALGLLAAGLWLAEVLRVKGWEGLRWLGGYPWAAVPTCLFVALAALIAARGEAVRPAFRHAGFVIAVWATSWVSFEVSRVGLIALHTPSLVDFVSVTLWMKLALLDPLIRLVCAVALAVMGIYLGVRFLLRPISRWTILYLAVALLLVVPACLLTIRVVPAVNGATDYLHAVTMGYPTFWTVVLVAAAVALGRRVTRAPAS